MAESITPSKSDTVNLTAESDSHTKLDTPQENSRSQELDEALERSIEAASRSQLRDAITQFCKQNPEAGLKIRPLLPSPNIPPPPRKFQAVRGHKPKLGMAPRRQLASFAARKSAPSIDLASSSSDDDTDEGRARKKRKIERTCIDCEGNAGDPDGCCKDMRMKRHRIDEARDFLAHCEEAEYY